MFKIFKKIKNDLKCWKNPCYQIPTTCDGATWQYKNPPCGIMKKFG